jgi:cysteinyl-tRNA synthetase
MQKAVERENKTSRDIAAFYEENFVSDLNKLNITLPTEFVKATDLIQEQIDIIVDLEKKGYVYKIEGDGMYMDTSKVVDY